MMVKSDRFQSIIAIKLIGLANDMDMMGEVNRGIKISFSSEQISVWWLVPLPELVKHGPEVGYKPGELRLWPWV